MNNKGIQAGKGDYIPRKLYREYIHTMFRESYAQKSENILYERIKGEASDMEMRDGRPVVHMEDGREFVTDKAVLAPGNSLPLDPAVKNSGFASDKRYIRSGWDPEILKD